MFFTPRIGSRYQEGFRGLRTLVLGAHHICLSKCPYKELCCYPDTVRQRDYGCPLYAEFDNSTAESPEAELCLHNSNIIEIDAFCDDEAGYPAYSTFTKYLLGRKDALTPEEKFDLWDHLAFTNLLQCYVPKKVVSPYSENRLSYDVAIPSLANLLKELKPQVVYVWERITYEAITHNLSLLEGLQQESLLPEHPTMELYLFSYRTQLPGLQIKQISEILKSRFRDRKILPKTEGWSKKVQPIEKVIFHAAQRGIITYSNGLFVISANRPEKEGGYFLSQLLHLYNFSGWDDLDLLFVKYNSQGRPMTLRKIRHYNNTTQENILSSDIDYAVFLKR